MNIAMVSEHASPLAVLGGVDAGGQNVHVAALATEMAKQGNHVTVYTRRDDPALPKTVDFLHRVVIEHVDAGPARELPKDDLFCHMDEFADRLRCEWERMRPDVVHAHFWMSGRAALAAAAACELPVVQTFHALGIEKRRHQGAKDTSPPVRLAEERAIMCKADRVIATASQEVFELLRQGADPRRIRVVPCGVDLALFTPEGPAEQKTAGRRIVVLSRLVERKGIADVVEALADVPEAELVIAGGPPLARLGDDPEAQRLRKRASDCGVADRVHFRGRVDRQDVPALLRSADVVACVPWYEPFGIVPLEAMACGIPVVASAVGGLIDTVVHGVTGLHVPPKAPQPLANALQSLLADEERRAHLGRNGAARARARYGWPRIARDTLEIYESLLAKRTARAYEATN
ncbi:MAG: glycosyl transferase [Candidatus Eremiobacter antarcticus]|nr:glycosyltransferase [Candidatus Eremiobacteraeota bacterium]MBC5807382.1 glycosyltransferase [Candidatus Eremiobacteraeota bacterium]PZR63133.1 MAG: glycosyl transferase [Candidatus Eremiobacter sp. RRmetagenome_bin22]